MKCLFMAVLYTGLTLSISVRAAISPNPSATQNSVSGTERALALMDLLLQEGVTNIRNINISFLRQNIINGFQETSPSQRKDISSPESTLQQGLLSMGVQNPNAAAELANAILTEAHSIEQKMVEGGNSAISNGG
jgi:hypothetical protein